MAGVKNVNILPVNSNHMDPVQKQEQSHGVPCLLLFYIFVISASLSPSQNTVPETGPVL